MEEGRLLKVPKLPRLEVELCRGLSTVASAALGLELVPGRALGDGARFRCAGLACGERSSEVSAASSRSAMARSSRSSSGMLERTRNKIFRRL